MINKCHLKRKLLIVYPKKVVKEKQQALKIQVDKVNQEIKFLKWLMTTIKIKLKGINYKKVFKYCFRKVSSSKIKRERIHLIHQIKKVLFLT